MDRSVHMDRRGDVRLFRYMVVWGNGDRTPFMYDDGPAEVENEGEALLAVRQRHGGPVVLTKEALGVLPGPEDQPRPRGWRLGVLPVRGGRIWSGQDRFVR